MTKKSEIANRWLETCIKLYDIQDTEEQRMLFIRTCKAASRRFTAKELETAIEHMSHFTRKD